MLRHVGKHNQHQEQGFKGCGLTLDSRRPLSRQALGQECSFKLFPLTNIIIIQHSGQPFRENIRQGSTLFSTASSSA